MFDKEMMDALRADAEKLGHLTGEDHTPEFLADCEACAGRGYTQRTIHVYELGCGFSHPDVQEIQCEAQQIIQIAQDVYELRAPQ